MATTRCDKEKIEGLGEFDRANEIKNLLLKEEKDWSFGSEHRMKLWAELERIFNFLGGFTVLVYRPPVE